MIINQYKCSVIAYLTALCLELSCHNDPINDCNNGECCWPKETNKFVKRLDGSRAGLLGSGFIFQEQLSSSVYGPIQSCLMCPVQAEQINAMKLTDNLKENVAYDAKGKFRLIDSTLAYPYKVWGTLYELTSVSKLTSAPVYVFRLDKAEKVQ